MGQKHTLPIMALCASMFLLPAHALENELRIGTATVIPSSPEQWRLEGLKSVPGYRGGQDFVMDSAVQSADGADLLLRFDDANLVDEAGRWNVEAVGDFRRSSPERAHAGNGAASFTAGSSKLVLKPVSSLLLGKDARSRDFTIEFWLYPALAENGETVFIWKTSLSGSSGPVSQQLRCTMERNRLTWVFLNFFAPQDGRPPASSISLSGRSILAPRIWSHHIVRFDSNTGLLEYMMNGVTEATAYASPSGRESSTVWLPHAGAMAPLELAPNYSGYIDEFRIWTQFVSKPELSAFGHKRGVAISPLVDLGDTNTALRIIESEFHLPSDSGIEFFYQFKDEAVLVVDKASAWIPFAPGKPVPGTPRGRYLQVRIEFYPDGSGARSPAFSSLTIRYVPDPPPPPPSMVLARPSDSTVLLRWSRVPDADLRGYMVYYGESPGEYFGTDALLGESPLDVGNVMSVAITGLVNGRSYYFAVASYDAAQPPHVGEFSQEVAARPTRIPQ